MTSGAPSGDPAEPRRSPYQGLAPYAEADSAYFFGREGWRDLVIDNLVAYRLTVLYGTSGVGKSSLMRAGVMPELRARARRNLEAFGRAELVPVAFGSWKVDPIEGLKKAIRSEIDEFVPSPPQGPLAAMLEDAGRQLGGRLLVILDQFEEYLAYHAAGHPLVEELGAALGRRDVPANFLVSIREDALAKLDRLEWAIPFVWRNLLRVEQLDRAAGRLAIVSPLRRWELDHPGDRMEADGDLVEEMLRQVTVGRVREEHEARGVVDQGAGGTEDESADGTIEAPYLQLVMTRLWEEERKRGSSRLTLETLTRLGGAERIVRSHLDQTMTEFPRRERTLASRLFTYLVTPAGTKIALPAEAIVELSGRDEREVGRVLSHLIRGEARILRAIPSPAGGPVSYEIFHDRLVPGILAWRRRFLERRRRRRVGLAVALLALLALSLAVGLGSYSLDTRATAVARLETIAVQEQAAAQYLRTVLRGHRGALTGAEFSPDGSRVLTAGIDGTARLWAGLSGQQLFSFDAGGDGPAIAHFSGDGRRVLVHDAQTVTLWDVATRRRTHVIRDLVRAVDLSPNGRSLAIATSERLRVFTDGVETSRRLPGGVALDFDPRGGRLAVGTADGCVITYDVRSLRPSSKTCLRTSNVARVAFSPDGQTLAVEGGAGTVFLARATGGGAGALRFGGSPGFGRHAFSSDGRQLVTIHEDEETAVVVWNARTRKPLGVLQGHSDPVRAFDFSPDGRRIATAAEDGTAQIWDTRTRRALITLAGHQGPVVSVDFSRDGRFVVTASSDGTGRIWQIVNVKPDLVARLAGTSAIIAETGRVVVVEAEIANKGGVESSATTVDVLLEGDSGEDVASLSGRVESIRAGSSRRLQFEIVVPEKVPRGRYDVVLIVDPVERVDEATKENNVATRPIDVPRPPAREETVETVTIVERAREPARTVTETVTRTVTVTVPQETGPR